MPWTPTSNFSFERGTENPHVDVYVDGYFVAEGMPIDLSDHPVGEAFSVVLRERNALLQALADQWGIDMAEAAEAAGLSNIDHERA